MVIKEKWELAKKKKSQRLHSTQLNNDTYTSCIAHKSRAKERFSKDGPGFKSDTTPYKPCNLSMLLLKPLISHL